MVVQYLDRPTNEGKDAAIAAARYTDNVNGGYWTGSTNSSDDIGDLLEKWKAGDKPAWAKFLASNCTDMHDFVALKSRSPFKDEMVTVVDYGLGFATLHGDCQRLVDVVVRQHGLMTYQGDRYLIVMPKPTLNHVEAIWVGGAHSRTEGRPTD